MNTIEKEALSFFDDGKAFPPGFRFHPTDEELILYHLKGKMCNRRFKFDVIAETNVYNWDPEEFAGLSKLKTGDRQWFFFTPRDRKYPNGARSNRTTRHGYWKLTGKDRTILCNSRSVGVKKTLVYYIGRSPSGERTDWVMHEYTLTEDEVKRCQSITDYYALYKVFKKSGPGPKNGEQYGAPFREEDWEDEEVDANNRVEWVNNVKEVDLAPSNTDMQILLNDFDVFMNKIADDPVHIQSVGVEPNGGFSLGDLVGEEEEEAHLSEQSLVFHQPSWPNYNGEGSFDVSQSNILYFNNEAPEVTSTVTIHLSESNIAEGDLEEFIELDDLFRSDLTDQHELENSQFDEFFDGLEEFDLYKDLLTCLDNGEEQNQELIYHQDTNNMNNGVVNHTYNFEDMQSNFQLHGPNTNYLPLLHDPSCNDYTYDDALEFQTASLATPGVINDSNCSKHHETGANENNSWKQDKDGKDSAISSLLWSFVESIPTTPASAAENALVVNRAFERMSSFSKLRLLNDVASSAAASVSKNSGNNKHRCGVLLCFSVVGMLCAVLWMMMIGTTTT